MARRGKSFKQKLIDGGQLIYECKLCGQKPVWNGEELILQLDHIDGDSANNTVENLRILCPNCHTQTNTYGGKNNRLGKFVTLVCVGCGVTFERQRYLEARRSLREKGPYCNKRCSSKDNGKMGLMVKHGIVDLSVKMIEVECLYCHVKHTRKLAWFTWSQKNRNGRIFCNATCKNLWERDNKQGPFLNDKHKLPKGPRK